MEKTYQNIKRAPAMQLNEHAQEISIPAFPESIQLYLDTYQPGDYTLSGLHWHQTLQFNVVLEGSLLVTVNDQTFSLQKGEGVFLNKNVLHSLRPEDDQLCVCYSLQIPASAICSEKDILLFEKYVTPMLQSGNISSVLLRRGEPWKGEVLDILERCFTLAQERAFACELRMKEAILKLWILMLEHLQGELFGGESADPVLHASAARLKEMMSYVQQNYREKIALRDIADAANISASECSRVFRRFLHTTPIDYLTQVRITRACKLLCWKKEKASAIGEMVGFPDYSYFHRVFKKYMHCTPKEYQASMLAQAEEHTREESAAAAKLEK